MRFNLVLSHSFSHVQCPSFSTFSDPLYTGEIYESNRLHLNPHQFSGPLFYLTSTKEKNYNGSYKSNS